MLSHRDFLDGPLSGVTEIVTDEHEFPELIELEDERYELSNVFIDTRGFTHGEYLWVEPV